VSSLIASPRLADHVRACQFGDQMIFLDLRRSKYFGMAGPQLPALACAILEGQAPVDADVTPRPLVPAGLIDRLRNQHLLSDRPAEPPARRPPRFIEPVASLDPDGEGCDGRQDWRHLARLWHSTYVTTAWLRRRNLAEIAEQVASLRTRHPDRAVDIGGAATRAAAATYIRLRPFALTSHDRCLNDSLALVHFLGGQGLFAQWVIGVRVHPFGAHSWVQADGVVLNDHAEHVRHYRPILVV